MAKANMENLNRWKAMQGFRSSNAAQPHVPGKRKGTRKARNVAAIREGKGN